MSSRIDESRERLLTVAGYCGCDPCEKWKRDLIAHERLVAMEAVSPVLVELWGLLGRSSAGPDRKVALSSEEISSLIAELQQGTLDCQDERPERPEVTS